eukprot:GHUV01002947.1.p1 GENE.GHUV01002947.1~~GHUV01002947.1.p1  ORF type:complete len:342 (+),score=70.53 GHUV01002947.1:232-1257(+)
MLASIARGTLQAPLQQAYASLLTGLRSFASEPATDHDKQLPQMPPFDYKPVPYTGPSKEEVIALRKKFLSPAMFWHFREPVMITEGKMQYLFDEKGKRYLDAFAGIVTVSVGHCHPEVVAAVNRQNQLLQHTTTIYLNNEIAEYAKELADRMPGNLKVVYFVNSGSEANDMALMLARAYSGNYDIIALRNGYHGMSAETMGLCGQHTWKQPIPQGFGVRHAMNPDPYRGPFGNDGKRYAADLADLIAGGTSGQVAGFIAETIQGVGGATPLADGYLPEAYKVCGGGAWVSAGVITSVTYHRAQHLCTRVEADIRSLSSVLVGLGATAQLHACHRHTRSSLM